MISDAALLLMIVDDERALLVLAAWGGLQLSLSDVEKTETVLTLAMSTGLSESSVRAKLHLLLTTRVLVDGGITDLADKMLQTLVQAKLDGRKNKRK